MDGILQQVIQMPETICFTFSSLDQFKMITVVFSWTFLSFPIRKDTIDTSKITRQIPEDHSILLEIPTFAESRLGVRENT